MKIKCDNCGKTFRRKTCLSEFNRYQHHFCSRKCTGEYRGKHTGNTIWDSTTYNKIKRLRDAYKQKKALEKMF